MGFIPDKLKSLCLSYVMGATLQKRNEAEIFLEEFGRPLGILLLGRLMGQSNSSIFGAFQGAEVKTSEATCPRFRPMHIDVSLRPKPASAFIPMKQI